MSVRPESTANRSRLGAAQRGLRRMVHKVLHKVLHLVKRFWWAVTARPLDEGVAAWVATWLTPGEAALFARMSAADQRHHVQVARRFVRNLEGDAERVWVAGALLHDVGKIMCRFGTFGRVVATFFPWLAHGEGDLSRYWRHEEIGASLALHAGSNPTTVALIGRWPDAPPHVAAALSRADNL